MTHNTKHTDLVTLPLDTTIQCPHDPTHKFELREGLAASSIEKLIAVATDRQEQIRKALEHELKSEADHRLAVELHKIRSRQAEEIAEMKDSHSAIEKALKDARRAASEKALSEIKLQERIDELKAQEEVKIAKAIQQQRQKIREEVAAQVEDASQVEIEKVRESMSMQIKQLETQRDQAKRAAADLERKMTQSSMQLQGEAFELEIEDALTRLFPHDGIREVPKGVRGVDVLQEIRTPDGNSAGILAWECKNAKAFSKLWIDKIKSDQVEAKADLAVIVTTVMPDGLQSFGLVDGAWICDIRCWKAFAQVLRHQMVQVALARRSAEGRDEKMGAVYSYLVGPEFSQRVEIIMRSMISMREQVQRERRAFEKQWSAREKLVSTVESNMAQAFGGIQGVVGAEALPGVPSLELSGSNNT